MNASSGSILGAARCGSRSIVAAALVASMAVLAGCAGGSNSASVYGAGQAQREQVVRYGVVESVRPVTIDRGQTGVGTAGGAIVGGVAGNSIGGGRGQIITSVLGAIAGGIAGQAAERGLSKSNGLEITVKFDNGEVRSIVQEADETFYAGDRVRVLSGTGVTRVTHR
ncbi:glycine zipper 2TM domain-containing protein [Pigmentiphaga soli]|uniref:Glycine zipper 2TM domain-containing protein n=1 Tax=Pigmentiphaga soli TaxID=1007095 RepID=A0ABP8GU57_9BURK